MLGAVKGAIARQEPTARGVKLARLTDARRTGTDERRPHGVHDAATCIHRAPAMARVAAMGHELCFPGLDWRRLRLKNHTHTPEEGAA
jgi:hypothetical protein